MSIDTGSDPDPQPLSQALAAPETPGLPDEPPERRNAGRFLALGIAIVVLLGALGFFFLRESNGTALALSFTQGQTRRFHMTMSMDGTISAGSGAAAQSAPLKVATSSDVQWRVESVDPSGTATVSVTISNLTVSSGGQSQPVPSPPAVTIHVTRGGRVQTTSGLTIGSGSGQFPGLGGNDQLSTLLPDHAVSPGDTWSKSVTRTIFGSTVTFQTSGAYLRDERVGTVDAAIIQTKQTMPIHLTLIGKDFATFLPALSGVIPPRAKVTYSGQVEGTSTAWIDPAAKQLLKSQTDSRFSFDISITGLPSAAGLGSLRMAGTESVTFAAR